MPRTDFSAMPDDARLWVFSASRELSGDEKERLLDGVDAFLEEWKAHGVPLSCARDWRRDRFLLVAVDPRSEPPSGCSIDAMVRHLKGLETALDVRFTDNAPVMWLHGGGVRRAPRGDFARMATAGEVGPATTVFDNTITRVGQLRAGEWERPARESWHGRAFFSPEGAGAS